MVVIDHQDPTEGVGTCRHLLVDVVQWILPREEANNLAVVRHLSSVETSLSDSVLRVRFDREENKRTGQRLLCGEGARDRHGGPEGPLGTSSEIRARVLPS